MGVLLPLFACSFNSEKTTPQQLTLQYTDKMSTTVELAGSLLINPGTTFSLVFTRVRRLDKNLIYSVIA